MTTLETETTQTEMTCDTHTAEAGVTLMELIASLSVIAVIIIGALALYGSATTSQASTQLISDITALKGATKQLYLGQGSYGTGSLNTVLINAGRVPTTIKTDATNGTLTHSLNGTVTVTGATGTFTLQVTNIPSAVCTSLMTTAQDWASVNAGGGARPLPVTPDTAATDCAGGNKNVTFTSSN